METVKPPDSHPEIILERLIQENQVSLKRLCYLYLHDEDLAEDAVQETFLKMLRSLSDYRGEANKRTYLTRIAINTCKDTLVQSIAITDDVSNAVWTCIGYTVLLCFTLFKTSSLAKSVFNAH